MASLLILNSAGAATLGMYIEVMHGPFLSTIAPSGMAAWFAATPLVLVGTELWSLVQGQKVGQARSEAVDAAQKDGEKDVEARYGLPNLYAQGTSNHVKKFNAVQRSHQHTSRRFPLQRYRAWWAPFHFL